MISFVTAYYNRKTLFIRTLESILWHGGPEFEFVVVDDGSREEERIEDLVERFPFLRVYRLDPGRKWYMNPCIPFNFAIRQAKGDAIVLQNPECLHVGPILRHVHEHLRKGVYLTYACYALSEADTLSLHGDASQVQAQAGSFTFLDSVPVEMAGEGWYNHSRIVPNGYHYCNAITRHDLEALGGFDERYALGFAYDDVELFHRIRMSGLEVRHVDKPSVLHQYHYVNKRADVPWDKFRRNETVYRQLSEPSPCVNINGSNWGDPYDAIPKAANEALDELLEATAKIQIHLAEEKRLRDHAMRLESLLTSSGESTAVLREAAQGALHVVRRVKRSPVSRWAWRSRHQRELQRIAKWMKKAAVRESRRKYEESGDMYLKSLRAASTLLSAVSARVWWWKGDAQRSARKMEAQTKALDSWWQSEIAKYAAAQQVQQ
ncbi:GT2 family glycosyltransferase [Roseimicrobium gellanilyticum]|uniref:GT2 family glycosyltransferase n=1 Tax=Roseimicrobium gellanilyticum TaxID=748857 RepID=A0A366HRN1_9BACT|nr:glycosyltransferase [Roseimicrobium gellanilyticum]RBP46156.1 GT2 family glycosyltransferase [Roseimicrobium gellanilyticum]